MASSPKSERGRGEGDGFVIELTVNGKPRTAPEGLTLLEYLQSLEINPQIVAVEYNGDILKRQRYAETVLQAGDRLEIVRMVGGGARSSPTVRRPYNSGGGFDGFGCRSRR